MLINQIENSIEKSKCGSPRSMPTDRCVATDISTLNFDQYRIQLVKACMRAGEEPALQCNEVASDVTEVRHVKGDTRDNENGLNI